MTGYTLICPFLDESESFVLGFECGKLWALMEAGISATEQTVHAPNQRQIALMAEALGYVASFTATEIEGWVECQLRRRPLPMRPAA